MCINGVLKIKLILFNIITSCLRICIWFKLIKCSKQNKINGYFQFCRQRFIRLEFPKNITADSSFWNA